MGRVRIPAFGTRPIRTVYKFGRKEMKVTKARWANKAVPNAVMHMQLDDYGATRCEVYDEQTGEVHAQINRSITGDIHIIFMRKVKEGM